MSLTAGSLKTNAAFALFREKHGLRTMRISAKNADELALVNEGIHFWVDGPETEELSEAPEIPAKPDGVKLWVVRPDTVVYSDEYSEVGKTLENGFIKHSNLTGGAPAHCAGELLLLSEEVIAVTGASGRYGPESSAEMASVAAAFKASGYGVWSYGYDDELNIPFLFGSRLPDWVS